MSEKYSEKYLAWMNGESEPSSLDITDGFSNFPEAIIFNRRIAEYAPNYWGFMPSTKPFSFAEKQNDVEPALREHLEFSNTDGYIELENGAITHEYYAPGMHKGTTHCTHSVSKSWTSAVWSEFLLPHLDKTVESLLPELKGTAYEGVRLRQMVDFQVPILWSEDYTDPNCQVVLSCSASGLDIRKGIDYSLQDFIPTLTRDPELSLGDWHYVSANTLLMAKIGNKLSNQHAYKNMADFHQLLGLEYRSGTTANFHGEVTADGGLDYSLRDFVKLPYAMSNGGKVGEQQALSQAYIDDIFTEEASYCEAWRKGAYGEAFPGVRYYRNQWYILNQDCAMGIGSFGQFILFNRKKNKAIAKFSTYKHGQDFETALIDIAWLIERIL